MAPSEAESSEPKPSLASVTSEPVTDLTEKIIRQPGDQSYSASGGFGDVFRSQCACEDGVKEVAVKVFRFNFSVDEDEQDEGKAARMIRRELGIWRCLDHPNIAYGFGRQGSASLVSMWMPHGTLQAFLKAHGYKLRVAHRLQLLMDIANGLCYLHSFPMVHGDLTSTNVLLDHDYNARLTDFGCSSLVGELPEGFTELVRSTWKPGTLRWTAPEHISLDEEEVKHTVKSDIYSFGHIALLTLYGKYPWSEFRHDAAVVLSLARGLKPGRPVALAIDDGHWALIEQCWSSASERPLAEDLISSLRQLLGVVDLPGTVSIAESLTRWAASSALFACSKTISMTLSHPQPARPRPPHHFPPPLLASSHHSGVTQVNTTSWFGTFSGTFPQLGGQGTTDLQIHAFGLFQVSKLAVIDIRPQIRTDLWPKNIKLNLCKKPVKSNMELLSWLKRHQPWMRLMRFTSCSMGAREFRALNKFMTERRTFAYAGWQLPTGKFSYNIFIFPMGADFGGAVFANGPPVLPGRGNAIEVQPQVGEAEPQPQLNA